MQCVLRTEVLCVEYDALGVVYKYLLDLDVGIRHVELRGQRHDV